MEVKIIKVYSMWHAEKQCQLTLALGHVVDCEGNVVEPCVDNAGVLFKKDVCRVAREYNKIVAVCLVKHLCGIGLRYAANTVDKWLDECSQP